MAKPSILLLNNHPFDSGNPGQVDALHLLARRKEIGAVSVVNAGPRAGETQEERDRRVIDAIRMSKSDVILGLSLKNLIRDMEGVQGALSRRPLIYWEGDGWGRGKPVSAEMGEWLRLATEVFSVGGGQQARFLSRHGATTVKSTINTYDHVLFADSESGRLGRPSVSAAFLGANTSRIPLLTGIPGDAGRWYLVTMMRRRHREGFLLGGAGWPPGWSVGRIPFHEMDKFVQRAWVLVHWAHFPKLEGFSDRLPTVMVSGRAQLTTSPPGVDFLPGEESGLFLAESPREMIDRVEWILGQGKDFALATGRAAHDWARFRVSHREAMRHMLSSVFPEVERPPSDPWDRLPGPWRFGHKAVRTPGP